MGGSKAGGLPTLPFPLSLPSPFPFPLSFQTYQWEGRSDPVRDKSPAYSPTNTTLRVSVMALTKLTDRVRAITSDNESLMYVNIKQQFPTSSTICQSVDYSLPIAARLVLSMSIILLIRSLPATHIELTFSDRLSSLTPVLIPCRIHIHIHGSIAENRLPLGAHYNVLP